MLVEGTICRVLCYAETSILLAEETNSTQRMLSRLYDARKGMDLKIKLSNSKTSASVSKNGIKQFQLPSSKKKKNRLYLPFFSYPMLLIFLFPITHSFSLICITMLIPKPWDR